MKTSENWLAVAGYPDYQVSDKGNIRSFGDSQPTGWITEKGYKRIHLMNEVGDKKYYVHRLVALAFIPNPKRKPCVNHIDGNKINNVTDNLELATYAENNKHARRVLGIGLRPVYGISMETGNRLDFPSLVDAKNAGFSLGNIQKCISGRRKYHLGYYWFDAK